MPERPAAPTGDLDALVRWRDALAAEEVATGASAFKGIPDRWWDAARWRCPDGHVSGICIKSEFLGAVCFDCGDPVILTYPEDREDDDA